MRPTIYLFDGHAINDGTNYEALFVGDAFFSQADGKVNLLRRADNVPVMASIEKQAKKLTLQIISRSSSTDFSTAFNELNKWFDTFEGEEKVFIVKDASDSNRQWYLNVTVEKTPKVVAEGFFVDLIAADPIWRTVTSGSVSWSVTASPDTEDITIVGNRFAKPIFDITPTSAKTGGFSQRMYRGWTNPLADSYDNHPQDVVNAAWDTRLLVANTAKTNQINKVGGITAVDTSFPIDTSVGGGLTTTGGVLMVDSEQIKYSGISAGTLTVSSGGRGWGGTTAAVHADNAVLKQSTMLANGADIQVYVDKRKVSRWVYGVNTATTKVFIAGEWDDAIEFTLYENIANTGDVLSIKVTPTAAALDAMDRLQKKGSTFTLLIDSELFTGTGLTPIGMEITGTVRAVLGSSMAAHTKGATIKWIEHEIYVCWGDLSAVGTSDDVTALQSETHKPMIDMANSTNANWQFTEFWDEDGLRAGGFKREVIGRNCAIVGGSHGVDADPATEIGLLGQVYEVGGSPRANTYDLRATLFHPAGFTSISCAGDKYRATVGFAKVAGLYAGLTMQLMASKFNESSPGSAATWTAWSQAGVALGGATYIQFRLAGNISATENNMHSLEVQSITALAIGANRLALSYSGAAESVYEIGNSSKGKPARITNTETGSGEYIEIMYVGKLNETLRIDCNAETVTNLANNTRADASVSYPPRDRMFGMIPGTDGTNLLKWEDEGSAGLTIGVTWANRNT